MTLRLITFTAASLMVTSTLGVLPALAQSTPTAASSATVPSTAAQTPQGSRAEARAEKWISDLHGRLRITPAEQPQWDALAGVMRANAAHMDQVFSQQQGDPAKASALDDMRAYAAITQARAQDLEKLLPAFEALYNAMSPQQKQTADSVFHQYARQAPIGRAATHSG